MRKKKKKTNISFLKFFGLLPSWLQIVLAYLATLVYFLFFMTTRFYDNTLDITEYTNVLYLLTIPFFVVMIYLLATRGENDFFKTEYNNETPYSATINILIAVAISALFVFSCYVFFVLITIFVVGVGGVVVFEIIEAIFGYKPEGLK